MMYCFKCIAALVDLKKIRPIFTVYGVNVWPPFFYNGICDICGDKGDVSEHKEITQEMIKEMKK